MPLKIDPKKVSEKTEMLGWRLEGKVIGQDRAIHQFCKAMGKYYVGMNAPNRPIATLLFMGPTGVGKTELVHALAEILLSDREAITRIDCAEFNHSHEVAKLIGSPPGYIGHRESTGEGRLSQNTLDKWSVKKDKVSGLVLGEKKPNILLFDEIEKAHEDFFDLMLAIMESGKLTLGNNAVTDFSRTILVMTSNLGSKDVSAKIQGQSMGFHAGTKPENLDDEIYKTAKAVAKKFFKPEFMNRVDRLVVFRSLTRESLEKICRLEFLKIKRRVNSGARFIDMKMTPQAVNFILTEGTSEEYGARELKRALERYIAEPISNLIGSMQLVTGDCLTIHFDGKELTFEKTYDPLPRNYNLEDYYDKQLDKPIK